MVSYNSETLLRMILAFPAGMLITITEESTVGLCGFYYSETAVSILGQDVP